MGTEATTYHFNLPAAYFCSYHPYFIVGGEDYNNNNPMYSPATTDGYHPFPLAISHYPHFPIDVQVQSHLVQPDVESRGADESDESDDDTDTVGSCGSTFFACDLQELVDSAPVRVASNTLSSEVNSCEDSNIGSKRKRVGPIRRRKRYFTPEAREQRNRRRRVNKFPRLLKSDIRRNYAQMFTNVINAYDGALMRRFVTEFCIPNVQLIDFAPENIPYGLPPLAHQIGMKNILKYWASNSMVIPDFVCQTQSVQLCVDPSTNRSRVVCKTLFKGTKVLDIALGEVDRQIASVLLPSISNVSKTSSSSVGASTALLEYSQSQKSKEESDAESVGVDEVFDSTEEKYCSLVPIHDTKKSKELQNLLQHRKSFETSLFRTYKVPKPLNPPVSMFYEGSMILYLDEHFRIYRLEFLGSQVNKL